MKRLQHGHPPAVLDNAVSSWGNFRGTAAVQEALFPVQYGLCSYCEHELSRGYPADIGYHIEHIDAKALNPQLTFEYSNLMLSCFDTGSELRPDTEDPAPVSCGHAVLKQANQYDETLFIRPTEADCERYFFYELDGRIVPADNLSAQDTQRAVHTIEVLNLNCLRLIRHRAEVISEGYRILSELEPSPKAQQTFIELELSTYNGKLRAFINTRKQIFAGAG